MAANRAEIQSVVVSRKVISLFERRTAYCNQRAYSISCYQSCDWYTECYEIPFHKRQYGERNMCDPNRDTVLRSVSHATYPKSGSPVVHGARVCLHSVAKIIVGYHQH